MAAGDFSERPLANDDRPGMKNKKKMIIVTANDFLAYQPSILNLYDYLEPVFETCIVSFEPEYIGKEKPAGRKIHYLKVPFLLKWTVLKFDFALQIFCKMAGTLFRSLSHEYLYYHRLQYHYLKKFLRGVEADEFLAVDIPALYITQRVFGKCHFFSLELYPGDPFRKKIEVGNILSVIIQNKDRYNFLFPGIALPVFYIQNAPVFTGDMIRSYERKDLVWAGTITRHFAVLDCINFIKNYPSNRLTLKGGAERKTLQYINDHYKALLESGNLCIDQAYLSSGDFIDFLAHFKIGFCFYSWEIIKKSINYQTAPSGKLFMYLAAGVPVIACNIPGFQFVREFGAGVLIDDYKPETILRAIQLIEKDYEKYSQSCYRASVNYSFDRTVKPFIDFLIESDTI
jgi:glycosyltransferase involved in cell wall biosynthesis